SGDSAEFLPGKDLFYFFPETRRSLRLCWQTNGVRTGCANPVGRSKVLRGLQRRVVSLTRADANDAIDVGDEDLAVADLAGLRGLQNRFHHLVREIAADSDLDLGLRHEVDDVLGSTVELG